MIKQYENPDFSLWTALAARPRPGSQEIAKEVKGVFDLVREEKDRALFTLGKRFDHVDLEVLEMTVEEIEEAKCGVDKKLRAAIDRASENIDLFHRSQKEEKKKITVMPGIECWRESRPIQNVGLYIPGGSAPLFSTVMMLAIPARIAQCQRVILCSPPQADGLIHPAIAYAASISGVRNMYKVGGAQAIAAMALGTESIPKVDKIFGPGNQYVTQAKLLAQQFDVAIDIPAGPSEVLIIADDSADADFVAADMLSQAEHGVDSQVVLLSDSKDLIKRVEETLADQVVALPRKDTALEALSGSMVIKFDDLETCMNFSNEYAPEHLIIATDNAQDWVSKVENAGSVFLGHYSPEAIGDYASGTNHTLPTTGWARSYGGVSLDSFVKKITFQSLSREGLLDLGPTVEILARAESLEGHARAVSVRLNKVQ